jgi:hypothetical protein
MAGLPVWTRLTIVSGAICVDQARELLSLIN